MSNSEETADSWSFGPARPWQSRLAQELFGKALVETGRKYKDLELVRLGLSELKVARRGSESD